MGNKYEFDRCFLECTCYDHADSCEYDVALKTGVCQDCYHDTMGVHCDVCVDGTYRNQSVELNDPNVCIGKCITRLTSLKLFGSGPLLGRRRPPVAGGPLEARCHVA